MGDIADYLNEQGEDMWNDHQAGHPIFDPNDCPYCLSEDTEYREEYES